MKREDLIGNIYSLLTVIEYLGTQKRQTIYLCKCDCGKEIKVFAANLKRGNTKSCGCVRKNVLRGLFTTHGLSKIPEYKIWGNIRNRCRNPKNRNYYKYGGAGVEMCDRWADSFVCFFEDMGPRPTNKHTVDRYPNNTTSGKYEPGNCRWATQKEQQGNRTNNVWIEYNGKRMILADWANYLGWNYYRLKSALKRKSIEEIILSVRR